MTSARNGAQTALTIATCTFLRHHLRMTDLHFLGGTLVGDLGQSTRHHTLIVLAFDRQTCLSVRFPSSNRSLHGDFGDGFSAATAGTRERPLHLLLPAAFSSPNHALWQAGARSHIGQPRQVREHGWVGVRHCATIGVSLAYATLRWPGRTSRFGRGDRQDSEGVAELSS